MKRPSDSVPMTNTGKAQLSGGTPEMKLMPPYLRLSVPAERAKIDAEIKAAIREFFPAQVATKAVSGLVVGPERSGPTSGVGDRAPAKAVGELSPAPPPMQVPAVPRRTVGTKKTTVASMIPDGVVAVGWYCPTEFRADCSTGQTRNLFFWYLDTGPETFYLGKSAEGKIFFGIDAETYNLGVNAVNGTAQFQILCDVESGAPKYRVQFDPVTLNFVNQTPCVSLQGASFPDEQDPCELVGGNHGQRPKIKVNLSAPAGPSGQTVFLFMDDPHNPTVGKWASAGIDSFVIPYGQTSGEWEGFLGTRAVMSKKRISITARVNGQNSEPLSIDVKRN